MTRVLQAISEKKMFEYYSDIHVHVNSPGVGADNPLRTKCFININILSICLFPAVCPSNHILTIFPIQMHGRPMLTLP